MAPRGAPKKKMSSIINKKTRQLKLAHTMLLRIDTVSNELAIECTLKKTDAQMLE